MTTLFDLSLALARQVGAVYEGVATGGSATTIVDTAANEPANYWNGGTLFISSGLNIGKTAVVSSWALTGTTFTFATLTLLCAAGDVYTVCTNKYNRAALRGAINLALKEVGRALKIDSTLTGDGTGELSLPAGVRNVRRVVVDDEVSFHWKEVGGKLEFDYGFEPATSSTLDVWYIADHAYLDSDDDILAEGIPLELVVAVAGQYAVQARLNSLAGEQDPTLKDQFAICSARAREMRLRFPAISMPRDPRHGGW